MREEGVSHCRAFIPQLWVERPGVLYRWLAADAPAWGSAPVLDAAGVQYATVAEVDVAVRAFWVDGVWRRSAAAMLGSFPSLSLLFLLPML